MLYILLWAKIYPSSLRLLCQGVLSQQEEKKLTHMWFWIWGLTIFLSSPNVLWWRISENLLPGIFNYKTSYSCCLPFLWKQLCFSKWFYFTIVMLFIVTIAYCFGGGIIHLLMCICVFMGECEHDGEECGTMHTHTWRREGVIIFSSITLHLFLWGRGSPCTWGSCFFSILETGRLQ